MWDYAVQRKGKKSISSSRKHEWIERDLCVTTFHVRPPVFTWRRARQTLTMTTGQIGQLQILSPTLFLSKPRSDCVLGSATGIIDTLAATGGGCGGDAMLCSVEGGGSDH